MIEPDDDGTCALHVDTADGRTTTRHDDERAARFALLDRIDALAHA